MRRAGFTLLEVLIVMSILAILILAATSTINPILQVNRGKDAVRKKDLKRISVAFEEYYSDKGCYPTQEIIDGLNSVGCGTTGLYQLNPWPCDPNKTHYTVKVEPAGGCPNTFWVTTRLEAEKTTTVCNYGVASANKSWQDDSCFEESLETGGVDEPTATPTPMFDITKCNRTCNINCDSQRIPPQSCQAAPGSQCSGANCFYTSDTQNDIYCQVDCCGTVGCPYQ